MSQALAPPGKVRTMPASPRGRPLMELLEPRMLLSGIEFPADAGIISVASYGAIPNDGIDDTSAIQAAVTAAYNSRPYTVYFPDGVYDVSNQISLHAYKRVVLQGQSRDGTIIRLANNCPGFTLSTDKKPVLTFYEGTATSAVNFRNGVRDMTIDIGSGNAGAIGLRFMAHNQGVVENLLIKSSDANKLGLRGLDMPKAWPGPLMVKNVEVQGFDYGIMVMQQQYSITFENITLSNQRVAGIQNQGNALYIRNLTSSNTVRAVYNTNVGSGQGHVVLIDATLSNGSSSDSAIVNESGCYVFARNVSSSGYGHTINDNGSYQNGTVSEYHTGSRFSLFTSPGTSLNLPVLNTPTLPWQPLTDWQKVDGSQSNDVAAIQAAIDSGKKVIYFSRSYSWGGTGTVYVRGNVERLVGMECLLGSGITWVVQDGTSNTVIFERFENLGAVSISTTRNVVVKNVMGVTVTNNQAGSNLFLEDVCGAPITIGSGATVWARQLNTEDSTQTNINNNGGTLWVLGLKTEKKQTVINTNSGGRTELLGGFFYPNGSATITVPALINNESSLSAVFMNNAYLAAEVYPTMVQETRGGNTLTLAGSSLPVRKSPGRICPLYVGYQDTNLSVSAVTASYSQSGYEPNKTIDNNMTTRWTADGDGQWIQYDLGSNKTVSSINIAWYNGHERVYTFDVLVSTDATNWTTALNRETSSGLTQGFETYDFTNATARYVRIVGHGNSVNTWTSMWEVDIFGF